MKKFIPAATAVTALLIGAATTAGPMNGMFNETFGEPAAKVTEADMTLDATTLFARVDIDGSGTLDVDEFASHRVILAELARFNRTVTVEGETDMQIALPSQVADRLSLTERSAIEAVARHTFHLYTDEDGMTAESFTAYRLDEMAKADRNRDGELTRHELERFAAHVAKPAQPRG